MELTVKVASITQGYPHNSDPDEVAVILFTVEQLNCNRSASIVLKLNKKDQQLPKLLEAWQTNGYANIKITL
jgi:hypothetical protein